MVPEPGQLVHVRQRPFVVESVLASSGLPDALRQDGLTRSQHLVTLSSIEDDALGDRLRVIWEVEPGASIRERGQLPVPTHGFDDPATLDAFLDAVRWGAISSADTHALQSPFRSGIRIEDYHLEPVVRAIQMPRVNLLIADDVGLGKTIESGLVAQEMILRHRVNTILVVCPSDMQIQWHDQMRDKFGLEFRIVDSALMHALRRDRGLHVNPWTHFPRLITSIDYLKRDRPMRLFREALPGPNEAIFPRRFDLLIVDEAHNAAPAGGGRYATDSDRTRAIRTLAPHFEHKLFLTATPHNGYTESFTSLLEMLDNQRFARGILPDPEQVRAIMVRRLKREIENWDRTPRFPARRLEAIEVPYTDEERRAHHLLHAYTRLRQARISSSAEKLATEFVLKLLKKRLFSSPAAFASTLARHEESIREAHRKGRATTMTPSLGILRRQLEGLDESFGDDDIYAETTTEAVSTATRLFRPLSAEEQALLDELRAWAHTATARMDTKARELLEWLTRTIKPNGVWSDERVIIFTEYRDTQKWLAQLLAHHGFSGDDRLMLLYGGMDSQERERIKAAFQAAPDVSSVRILLATDAASEGIDLQNHCARLIHYEIPWNPNRMEQRNGRIDRYGQRAKEVLVYHFVGAGYDAQSSSAVRLPGDLEGDLEFLLRAARKVETIREDLGKVGPVIAMQVEEAMLGKRMLLDTAAAGREETPLRSILAMERRLRDRVAELHNQLQQTKRDLRLSPDNIRHVASVGLALAGQPPLIPAMAPGLCYAGLPGPKGPAGGPDRGAGPSFRAGPDPSGRHREPVAFYLPALRGSWAACTEGLAHPHTGKIRPIVFDHALAEGRDDVVLAHLNHRLVQMCLRLLRAEVWATGDNRKLHRVTARIVPDAALDVPAVVAHGRVVVIGGDGHRLHEEIIAAGGVLRGDRFARLNVGEVRAVLDAATGEPVSETMQARLAGLWPRHAEALQSALRVRMAEIVDGMQRLLRERAAREIKDSAAILDELRKNILDELKEPEVVQLALFTTEEHEQLRRNIDSLRARADEIPAEIERERRAIEARYADPAPHLFPICVTYLVPERIARHEGR